jgi:copper chaperone CopZ
VRAALEKIDGVASIDADFETKIATITMQPGKTLTKADCEKAFEGTKYGVASFQ